MKKYSIVINVVNDLYVMVINKFDLGENNERINIETEILNDLSFADVQIIINNINK